MVGGNMEKILRRQLREQLQEWSRVAKALHKLRRASHKVQKKALKQ